MERRRFIEYSVKLVAAGVIALFAGCGRTEIAKPERFGNEDGLWKEITRAQETEAPLELAYAKDTQAFFRDESLGKVDPNFKPKIGGG